jgi:replicative superfamily II helicase
MEIGGDYLGGLVQLTQGQHHGKLYGNNNSIRNLCELLLLPEDIATYYEKSGIREVYDWQLECVNATNVSKGRNLLYCAPTGGGKSLIAELVLLMSVVTLGKKAMFILPYVSLVVEKEKQFKSIALSFNRKTTNKRKHIQVKSYYGDKNWNKNGLKENIIICTIDKANNILNTLILRGAIKRLGCVVIDEIHTLGESFNGFLLEVLIR